MPVRNSWASSAARMSSRRTLQEIIADTQQFKSWVESHRKRRPSQCWLVESRPEERVIEMPAERRQAVLAAVQRRPRRTAGRTNQPDTNPKLYPTVGRLDRAAWRRERGEKTHGVDILDDASARNCRTCLPASGHRGQDCVARGVQGAPALLVAFICNHCPYVKHVRHELARLGKEYQGKGVAVVGISSNDVTTHPDDSPKMMAREKAEVGYTFPYLYDETQQVALAYKAACTPDFYVFDKDLKLVYRGQLDSSRPGNPTPVTGKDLRSALDAVLAGKP